MEGQNTAVFWAKNSVSSDSVENAFKLCLDV